MKITKKNFSKATAEFFFRKNHLAVITAAGVVGSLILLSQSCASSKEITEKTGSVLWSENCGRCHNAPPSSSYSSAQWGVIGLHMRERARLTDEETRKIIEFLQSANE